MTWGGGVIAVWSIPLHFWDDFQPNMDFHSIFNLICEKFDFNDHSRLMHADKVCRSEQISIIRKFWVFAWHSWPPRVHNEHFVLGKLFSALFREWRRVGEVNWVCIKINHSLERSWILNYVWEICIIARTFAKWITFGENLLNVHTLLWGGGCRWDELPGNRREG